MSLSTTGFKYVKHLMEPFKQVTVTTLKICIYCEAFDYLAIIIGLIHKLAPFLSAN